MDPFRVIVLGRPAPEGSKKAMPIYRKNKASGEREFTGHANIIDEPTTRLAQWRQNIHTAAHPLAHCTCPDPGCVDFATGFPIDEPVIASMVFAFGRPRSHYRTGRNADLLSSEGLATSRPVAANIGDLEKLARAMADGLQAAGVLCNDKQIVEFCRLAKVWVDDDRTELTVPGAVVWLLPDRPVTRTLAPLVSRPNAREAGLW